MPSLQHILAVEDCVDTFTLIQHALKGLSSITWAKTVAEAKSLLNVSLYDLIVLDIELPDGSGLDLCLELQNSEVFRAIPILTLTAKDTIEDKIKGFQMGVDQYMTKPFDKRELKARVESMLFKAMRTKINSIVNIGDIAIDKNLQRIQTNNKTIKLTPTEFRILMLLLAEPGAILDREAISDLIWGDKETSIRQVDTQISKLRKKIGADKIQSIHGIGYRFAA